jgi:UDP-N-acetylglucosamine 2-epimerase
VPVDPVEAGLRSVDRDMPEEINRIVADTVGDLLLCPTRTAVTNLVAEGLGDRAHFVGDVMLDLVEETRAMAMATELPSGLDAGGYFLATIHRPSNTDDPDRLREIARALDTVSSEIAPVVLPVHPRLAARFRQHVVHFDSVRCTEPATYLETQGLIARARGVITDSGGLQKEALFHGIRCVTLRDSTEWIESLNDDMNVLLGNGLGGLPGVVEQFRGRRELSEPVLAAFGGGGAGSRIAGMIRAAGDSRLRWTRMS